LSANRRRSVRFGRVSAAAPGPRRFRRSGATQIAAELGLSLVTVKVHRGQVMRKMLAKSVAELVRMADRLGLPGAA
jgi:hypothetical protein